MRCQLVQLCAHDCPPCSTQSDSHQFNQLPSPAAAAAQASAWRRMLEPSAYGSRVFMVLVQPIT